MYPNPRASALLVLTLVAASAAWAKTSDRNQEMIIDAGHQEADYSDNGQVVWTQGVVVKQGTLTISADGGTLRMRNGDPSQASFTGKPVKLRQQLDDGTWMDAQADRIDYDMSNEPLTLTGNYTVTSPKGSNSGQKMVYNTKTGGMQAGGDGSRVRTVIKPKSAQGNAAPAASNESDER